MRQAMIRIGSCSLLLLTLCFFSVSVQGQVVGNTINIPDTDGNTTVIFTDDIEDITNILFNNPSTGAPSTLNLYLQGTGTTISAVIDNSNTTIESRIYLDGETGGIIPLSRTMMGDSPDWNGTIIIADDNTLTVRSTKNNPLGAWGGLGVIESDNDYATVLIEEGGEMIISRSANMGQLEIDDTATVLTDTSAGTVTVVSGETLIVNNDLVNTGNFKKQGAGDMNVWFNESQGTTNINLNNVAIAGGTLTLNMLDDVKTTFGDISVTEGSTMNVLIDPDGTGAVFSTLNVTNGKFSLQSSDSKNPFIDGTIVGGTSSAITVGAGGTLDIQATDQISVSSLNVADGGRVNIYARNLNGETVNTNYDTTGKITLADGAVFDLKLADGTSPGSLGTMTVLGSTQEFALGTYQDVNVEDDILGWDFYTLFDDDESPTEMYIYGQASNNLVNAAKTNNARNAATYIQNAERNQLYNPNMKTNLLLLDSDPTATTQLTGEIYASAINFQFLNAYLTMQQLAQQLRSIPLVTYPGGSTGQTGQAVPNTTGYGNWGTGGMNTAPYGPGYAPAYENGTPTTMLESVFSESILRGQGCDSAPPGSLIYSAWATYIGGDGANKDHYDTYAYDTKRSGGLIGLDLFCSTDCRSGLFYSFQKNKLNGLTGSYGNLEADDHLLGIYHEFGDEFVYNILTLRGGYSQFKTHRAISFANSLVTDQFTSKTKGFQGGITVERGANFQLGSAFTFSPYVGADYTYFYRKDLTEQSATQSGFALHSDAKGYHSIHSVVGATAALRMYPGDQEISLLARGNWTHEFLSNIYGSQSMSYTGFNNAGSFNVSGNNLGRDWALLGVGAEWAPMPELLLHVNWDYLRNKYTSEHLWAVGAAYRW